MATKDTKNGEQSETDRSSRFAYFGEDDDTPLEGGVYSVTPSKSGEENSSDATRSGGGKTRPLPPANGIPGPEARLLDISELVRTTGMHYVHKFHLPAGKEPDFEAATPIEGTLRLTNSGAALLLRGQVTTSLRMECGRCLTQTDIPIEADIEEDFDLITSHNAFRQEEVHAVDDDTPASVIKGNVLDLADLLRQNLLLAAPLKPLCREDCPGIVVESKTDKGAKSKKVASAVVTPEETPVDNPLRRLGELLEAKRNAENNTA